VRVKVLRPELSDDRWDEIQGYLLEQWQRAFEARSTQLDAKYAGWIKNYEAEPREKTRNFPWPKSSNIVIPLIRIYIDTFVARTLNILFATRPLYMVEGFPSEQQDSVRIFLNKRALNQWGHYNLVQEMLMRGAQTGSVFTKSIWDVQAVTHREENAAGNVEELEIITYRGPRTKCIPFEDLAIYPYTANTMDDVEIVFHRLRYVEEAAMRAFKKGDWQNVEEEDIRSACNFPNDVKRTDDATRSGVVDSRLKEMEAIECHLTFDLGDGKDTRIVGIIIPALNKMVDCYYNPYPPTMRIFNRYCPYPKSDFIYGNSMCKMLEGFQEEVTQIHNDRRNNSTLANTVCFKKKNGAGIPNPSSNYYPGKVFDVENMDDLDVMTVGRNYSDMIQEEEYSRGLADLLIGSGPAQQGMSSGSMGGRGKGRGTYNTGGTLGVLAEGNQRQDTNIRDARNAVGLIAQLEFLMCAKFGDDLDFSDLTPKVQDQIRQAFSLSQGVLTNTRFEVATSNAGANREIAKANLYQLAQVMGQYGTTVQQLSIHLMNPELNPGLRKVLTDLCNMFKWISKRLLYTYEEPEGEEYLPDVVAASQLALPQPGVAGGDPNNGGGATGVPVEPGAAGIAGGAPQDPGLQALLSA
jgi:hypothetical protein